MTQIKLCGLTTNEDIQIANGLKPDYIGFVFAKKSRRFVSFEKAKELKKHLSSEIKAVGVFVNENTRTVAKLLNDGIIDIAQLHGDEDNEYILNLRKLSNKPIIKAVKVTVDGDLEKAEKSIADYVLLDSGAGSGKLFDFEMAKKVKRPYFLAGGLDASNVSTALKMLRPFAVDVSSGIETDGKKDKLKMTEFVNAVRKEEIYD